MRHGLFFAPFGEMADPRSVVEVAQAAEEAGWDGLYLWDHVLRADADVAGDAWTCFAAVAATTTRLRLGPMVTPLSRRRVAPLARQVTALDHLSGGRFTLGVGLGVDTGGELTRFGEVVDPRTRAAILDEKLAVLRAAWAGEHVVHRGEHVTVDGVTFRPRPLQDPLPVWAAARERALRPVRRAAHLEGMFIIEVGPDDLRRALDEVVAVRGSLDGFDVAVPCSPIDDPALLDVPGVTWAMHGFPPDVARSELLAVAAAGPS